MDAARQLFITMAYLDEGIVPIPYRTANEGDQLRRSLESLTPTEARQAKRRFRKIFRRAVKWKKELIRGRVKDFPYSSTRRRSITLDKISNFEHDMGIGCPPSKVTILHRSRRRRFVFAYMCHRSRENT